MLLKQHQYETLKALLEDSYKRHGGLNLGEENEKFLARLIAKYEEHYRIVVTDAG
tara:strand:- start:369 stop:533 length:165 start_codon:yes stop_codon:yes gene_type:complete